MRSAEGPALSLSLTSAKLFRLQPKQQPLKPDPAGEEPPTHPRGCSHWPQTNSWL